MSELAEKKLKEWRSGAIRALLEVGEQARFLRNELELNSEWELGSDDSLDAATELLSLAQSVDTFVVRAWALKEAGTA